MSKKNPKPESYTTKIKRLALALPYEKRVEIIKLIKAGTTIGKTAETLGVEPDAVLGTLQLNVIVKRISCWANLVV